MYIIKLSCKTTANTFPKWLGLDSKRMERIKLCVKTPNERHLKAGKLLGTTHTSSKFELVTRITYYWWWFPTKEFENNRCYS